MTQSCVFEEGTVDISTIRILFRHEPTTISLAVAKEAVQKLNNFATKVSYERKDFAGRLLLDEDPQTQKACIKTNV